MLDFNDPYRPDPTRTITKLANDIGHARDLADMCRAVLGFARCVAPVDMLYLSLFGSTELRRRVAYAGGVHDGEIYEPDVSAVPPLSMNDAPQSIAIRERCTVVIDDLQEATKHLPRFPLRRDAERRPPRSSVAVPLLVAGDVVGALELQSAEPAGFSRDHVAMIEMAASLLAVATKSARQTEEARRSEQRWSSILESSSDTTLMLDRDGHVLWIGGAVEGNSGYHPEELVGERIFEFIHPEDQQAALSAVEDAVVHGRSARVTFRFRGKGGAWSWKESVATSLLDDPVVRAVVVNSRDVTERVRVEQELRRSEARIAHEREVAEAILRSVPGIFYMFDAEGRFLRWNQRLEDFVGLTADDMRATSPLDLVVEKDFIAERIAEVVAMGHVETEGHMIHRSGEHVLHAFSGERVEIEGVAYVLGVGVDISERERAARGQREAAVQLGQRVAELRLLQSASEALQDATLPLEDVFGKLVEALPKAFAVPERVAARIVFDDVEVASADFVSSDDAIAADIGDAGGGSGRIEVVWLGGSNRASGANCGTLADGAELLASVARMVSSFLDRWAAAERNAELTDQLQAQVSFLRALQRIDASMSSNADLDSTLGVILDAVLDVLEVDAADVLLYDRDTERLDIRAARGVSSGTARRHSFRLGEGWPGLAALRRQPVHVRDLTAVAGDEPRAAVFVQDGLVGLYKIPLIAKGELQGVLGVLKGTPLEAGHTWTEKAHAIAVQAALAIHAARTLTGLQQSHEELRLAYDRTIEGWAMALDLKDEETAGHSQRVTELTVELARRMGVRGEELTHIRRGALLHDIGKMGIPDRILLKPGKLDPEEWEVMKRHTTYARDFLQGIPFLERALEIPYGHHERFDGSGYPLGLAGAGIPLAARIFAVVDVFDALTSDRPYRDAWSRAEAVAYLREHAGSEFDPQVVETFLALNGDAV